MRIAKRLTAALLLVPLCALVAAVISPQPARGANVQAVQVTNTPLPVQINNAQVPISGTVAVSSLPAVTLNGTPQVSVSTTSSTPLFADAERAARNAVGANCFVYFTTPPTQVSCTLMTVPSGMTLVIETETCRADVDPGGGFGPVVLNLVPPHSQYYVGYDLALPRINNIPGSDNYALSAAMRLYADQNTTVSLSASGASGVAVIGGISCSIAGYLVAS